MGRHTACAPSKAQTPCQTRRPPESGVKVEQHGPPRLHHGAQSLECPQRLKHLSCDTPSRAGCQQGGTTAGQCAIQGQPRLEKPPKGPLCPIQYPRRILKRPLKVAQPPHWVNHCGSTTCYLGYYPCTPTLKLHPRLVPGSQSQPPETCTQKTRPQNHNTATRGPHQTHTYMHTHTNTRTRTRPRV